MSQTITTPTPTVRAGYVALTDCAPLIVAHELGFDRQVGLKLEPVRFKSWTAVRDGLAFEQLECAHMPGAMSLAMHLGLSGLRTRIRVPLLLGQGGNAITVSAPLFREGSALLGEEFTDNRAGSAALVKAVVEQRKLKGVRRVRFGAVYAFSSHNYELRAWLAHAGLDPDTDIDLTVVPRSRMVDALANGEIDGFCVGDPWGAQAVEAGIGYMVATKADLYPFAPEKVLAFRDGWAQGYKILAEKTVKALQMAMDWAADSANRQELAYMLADKKYLNVPADVLTRALSNSPRLTPGAAPTSVAHYLSLGGVTAPSDAQALWLLAQMRRWEQVDAGHEDEVKGLFRPFANEADDKNYDVTADPAKDAFDGVAFTVNDIEAYSRSFPIGCAD